jgi:hypothetical protein
MNGAVLFLEDGMNSQSKVRRVFDQLRLRLRDMLGVVLAQLGPLLKPGKLQPGNVPVRVRRK